MNLAIELFGWLGSALVLLAYILNLRGRWDTSTLAYLLCNVLGGILLIFNTIFHHAYPSALLNLVWVVVALPALLKPRTNRKS
ncbi:MAG: hypothetical protein H7Y12_00990 [Sphingobacteriaceae bacterium]|nr:hypothetical protein [Cytophagaceae bacterium]